MTTPAQPSFTPGPWTTDGTAITTTGHHPETVATTSPKICGPGMGSALANAALIAASPSLYAYAKAEVMLALYYSGAPDRPAWRDVIDHLRSIGWHETQNINTFIYTYRATALAIAEGRS